MIFLKRIRPRQTLVDKLKESLCGSIALVFYHLTVRSFHEEGGEAAYGLAGGGIGLLLGAYHANLARLSVDINGSRLHEFLVFRLYLLAVPTPVGVVHGKCVLIRVLETLFLTARYVDNYDKNGDSDSKQLPLHSVICSTEHQ